MDTPYSPSETPDEDDLGNAGVRDLLASQPSPGPMPEDVFARITGALREEQATRADDGGLTDDLGLAGVSPLVRPEHRAAARRPRRWTRVLTAAAGVAAVGVLGTLAVKGTGNDPGGSAAGPGASPSSGAASSLHIQLSRSSYSQGALGNEARKLLETPSATLAPSDAEAPAVGPIATRTGLDDCLASLGETGASAVTVDLATYEGRPAAIIVVTKGGATTAYAVQRDCSTGDPKILQDSVPVP